MEAGDTGAVQTIKKKKKQTEKDNFLERLCFIYVSASTQA